MIQGRMVYREGEGLIANISHPTMDYYEVDCSGLGISEMIRGGKCKETFLRREGPKIKGADSPIGGVEQSGSSLGS